MTQPIPAVKAKVSKPAKSETKGINLKKEPVAKKAETKLDAKNSKEVKKEITEKKDLLYVYPEKCTDLASRKQFRHKTRAAQKTFEKAIAKLSTSDDKKALKAKTEEYAAFRKNWFVNP